MQTGRTSELCAPSLTVRPIDVSPSLFPRFDGGAAMGPPRAATCFAMAGGIAEPPPVDVAGIAAALEQVVEAALQRSDRASGLGRLSRRDLDVQAEFIADRISRPAAEVGACTTVKAERSGKTATLETPRHPIPLSFDVFPSQVSPVVSVHLGLAVGFGALRKTKAVAKFTWPRGLHEKPVAELRAKIAYPWEEPERHRHRAEREENIKKFQGAGNVSICEVERFYTRHRTVDREGLQVPQVKRTAIAALYEKHDLLDELNSANGLSSECFWSFAEDVTHAIRVLHDQDVVHGDIKPENCLLESRRGGVPRVRLADFETSRDLRNPTQSQGMPGTPEYMPPETWPEAPLTKPRDMFALGVLLFLLERRRYPHFASSPEGLDERAAILHTWGQMGRLNRDRLIALDFGGVVPQEGSLGALQVALMDRDPSRRPSAETALEWIQRLRASREGTRSDHEAALVS